MSKIGDFNKALDEHSYVVIPTKNVGYMKADDNDSGWGEWHLDITDAIVCDKLSVHIGGEE